MLVGHLTLKVTLINELMLLLHLASRLLQWSIWLHSVPLVALVLVLTVRRDLPGRSLAQWYFVSSNNRILWLLQDHLQARRLRGQPSQVSPALPTSVAHRDNHGQGRRICLRSQCTSQEQMWCSSQDNCQQKSTIKFHDRMMSHDTSRHDLVMTTQGQERPWSRLWISRHAGSMSQGHEFPCTHHFARNAHTASVWLRHTAQCIIQSRLAIHWKAKAAACHSKQQAWKRWVNPTWVACRWLCDGHCWQAAQAWPLTREKTSLMLCVMSFKCVWWGQLLAENVKILPHLPVWTLL